SVFELLDIAVLRGCKLRQRILVVHFRPAASRREILVSIGRGHDARQHLAGGFERLPDVDSGSSKPLLKFALPKIRRGLWVVSQPAPQTIEVPITLELVIVVSILRIKNW